MNILLLAYKSLRNRRLTVALTITSIAVSIVLLLGVSRLNDSLEDGFTNSISGTDLIVGGSTGEEQLVLATVFHLGVLPNQVNWSTYEDLKQDKRIKWSFPISIGDAHKGFDVIGTDAGFFEYYQYGEKSSLNFNHGRGFSDLFDVVIGAKVAKKLGYTVGDELHLEHGSDVIVEHVHDAHSFRVSGILKETGTPVDNSLYIELAAFEGIHLNYVNGTPDEDMSFSKEEIKDLEIQPQKISAFFLSLKQRKELLSVQRDFNNFEGQSLTAASPSFTLVSLWSIMRRVETALKVISVFVVLSGLTGMLISLLTVVNERRREMAILRSLGASTRHIYSLIIGESFIITLLGMTLGMVTLIILSLGFNPMLEKRFGIALSIKLFEASEVYTLILVLTAGLLIGLIPAYKVHRTSLKDGMTIKT